MNPRAVVLIFHHGAKLRWFEEISLSQTSRVLAKHPIHLVCPEGTDTSAFLKLAPELVIDFVPAKWMRSLRSYNRMKILPALYQRYTQYEFMLTCELDCFVFKDELDFWCDKGFDYVGAPWISGLDSSGTPIFESGGNSGFSLRNIQSALRLMHEFHIIESPMAAALRNYQLRGSLTRAARDFVMVGIGGNSHWALNYYPKNEDRFWSCLGQKIDWFRLASTEDSIMFSFEQMPESLFKLTNGQLPFGCHAWQKYNPQFWRTHIEACGYSFDS